MRLLRIVTYTITAFLALAIFLDIDLLGLRLPREGYFRLFILLLPIAVILVEATWRSWAKFRTANPEMSKMLDRLASSLATASSSKVRVNVMRMEGLFTKRLSIAYYSSNMKGAQDLDLHFEKYEGNAGRAWAEKKPNIADLSLLNVEGGPNWGLDSKELEKTSQLAAILSIPIPHPSREGQIVGVLNIDSAEPIKDFLSRGDTIREASLAAAAIGELLYSFY